MDALAEEQAEGLGLREALGDAEDCAEREGEAEALVEGEGRTVPLGQPLALGLREALLQAVELRVAAGETVELMDSVEFGDGEEEAVRAALVVLLALCEELRVLLAVEEGE